MTSAQSTASISQLTDAVSKQLSSNDIQVPMLPEVASKVVRLTQDPESDSADLARLIQSDQPLAAHVMRVANSAAYSPNATLVSLQQAITRLGMRIISEIALAASINSSLFNTPGFEPYIQHILNHSLAAGLWAKETARACRKNVEAAFLAGLLNDIGRPVVVQTALQIAKGEGLTLSKADLMLIEASTKQAVGLAVLEAWEMPASVKLVVNYFDRYQEEHNNALQTKIVYAGTQIANHFFQDPDAPNESTIDSVKAHPVFAEINLYQDEVEQLLEQEDAVKSTMEAMGL